MLPMEAFAALNRWLGLSATALLLGALVLTLILPPPRAGELTPVWERLRRWARRSCAGIVLSTGVELVVRAHTMAGGGLSTALAAVPTVLVQTHFGRIWIGRSAALVCLLILLGIPGRVAVIVAFVAGLGVALTTSLTSHASAWGDTSFVLLLDWAHSVAASVWAGGLFGLALTVFRDRAGVPPTIVLQGVRRFSRLAGVCVLIVVITGVLTAWFQLGSPGRLGDTTYGQLLMVKLVFVAALCWLGAINRYRIIPLLVGGQARRPDAEVAAPTRELGSCTRRLADGSGPGAPPWTVETKGPWSRLSGNVRREAILALLVFGFTALLGETTPGRHAPHADHSREDGKSLPPSQPTENR